MILSGLELLPAPENFLAPRGQELITFKRLFVVAAELSLPRWLVRLQSESGVRVFSKKNFFTCLKVGVMSGWISWLF